MADINNPREYLEGLLNAVDTRDAAESALKKGEEDERDANSKLSSFKITVEREKSETVRRRKIDLEAGYDKQIRNAENEIKTVQDKRQKALNEGMAKRTAEATKSTLETAASAEKAFKAYVSAQKLPMFMRNKTYFSLFCPGIVGYIVLLAIFLAVLIISIVGISANMPSGGWPIRFFVFLLVLDILLMVAYALTWTNTRVKYRDQITAAKEILKSIKNSRKAASDIEKNIRKVGDDSTYGLEEFDALLSQKNTAKADIEAAKAKALELFENETKKKLYADIDAKYKAQIDELETKLSDAETTVSNAKATLNEQEALLSGDYVAYVGAENLTHAKAASLLELIDSGSVQTVTEAVSKLAETVKPQ